MASQVKPGSTQPAPFRGLQQSALLIRRRPAYSIRDSGIAASKSGCMAALYPCDPELQNKCLAKRGRPCMYGPSHRLIATVSGMGRRSVFDPLEPTREPRWYVVRNMHRAVLEARALPSGADLKRALVAAMLEHIDAGWQLGEFSSTGAVFFCTKGVERRMVAITPSDPQGQRQS